MTGELTWVRDESPTWDADKQRIIGGAPEGAFVLPFADGDALPGEWWSAQDDGVVVGYGRLDVTWGGDAEILLAVDPSRQEQGVGSFVLARLEDEAVARDINYVHNRIREHDQRDLVHDWLVVRGFRGSTSTDLRKRVGSSLGRPAVKTPTQPWQPAQPRQPTPSQPYDVSDGKATYGGEGDRPDGHEEQGGYVDVDEHQY